MAFNTMMIYVYNNNMFIEGFDYVYMFNTIVNNIIVGNLPVDYFGFSYIQIITLYNILFPLVLNHNINIPTIEEVLDNPIDE